MKSSIQVGDRYNKLVVVERLENTANGRTVWKCLCDCGNYTKVRGANLKNGAVKSCGCLLHRPSVNRTHGMSNTWIYRRWVEIRRRCYEPKTAGYDRYGGRGIKMCDEWRNDFNAFYEWVIESKGEETLTVERIDVNGDYCPENCKWLDFKGQAQNRTSCRYYTYNGKTQNLQQWCNELGLKYCTIHSRIYRNGWTFEKAITTPTVTDGYAMRKGRNKKNGC